MDVILVYQGLKGVMILLWLWLISSLRWFTLFYATKAMVPHISHLYFKEIIKLYRCQGVLPLIRTRNCCAISISAYKN